MALCIKISKNILSVALFLQLFSALFSTSFMTGREKMQLWIVPGYFIYGKKNRNYFLSSFIGLVCGLILTPVLFYLYTSYTKTSILPVDIGIFVISVVVSFALFAYIFLNYNFNFFSVKMGILLWELVFAMFIISYLLQ